MSRGNRKGRADICSVAIVCNLLVLVLLIPVLAVVSLNTASGAFDGQNAALWR